MIAAALVVGALWISGIAWALCAYAGRQDDLAEDAGERGPVGTRGA